MPFGKNRHKPYVNPSNRKHVTKSCQRKTDEKLFCFMTMDAEVENYIKVKFKESSSFFITDKISKHFLPQHMIDYKENTGRKILSEANYFLQ